MNNKFTKSLRTEDVKRKWYLFDASEFMLGRLATKVAQILNGKTRINYTSHVDMGEFVVVINAEMVKVSGNKLEDKKYHHYTGYPGGLRTKSYKNINEDNPTEIIKMAVKGMLSANKLRNDQLKRLKIYKGSKHPHEAQLKS